MGPRHRGGMVGEEKKVARGVSKKEERRKRKDRGGEKNENRVGKNWREGGTEFCLSKGV